jgi:ligand-binding sensor domain-containing protein
VLSHHPAFKHKKILVAVAVLLVIATAFAGSAWWRACRVLEESASQAAALGALPFTLEPLQQHAAPGLTAFSAAAEFRALAVFQSDIYVCGPSALYRYNSNGKLLQTWHTGQELPPYPLITLAVRQGVATPELWVATQGAGALIWDGRFFRQFQAQQPELRKLSALLPLNNGTMLLGTPTAGLFSTDGKQLTLFHPQLANVKVTALAGTQEAIWVGTQNQGVWLCRAGAVIRYKAELPDPQVLSLWSDGDSAWVGTPFGVAEFGSDRFRRRLADGILARTLLEHEGRLWIGTVDEGTLSLELNARAPRPSAGARLQEGSEQNAKALALLDGNVLAVSAKNVRRLSTGEDLITAPPASLTAGHIAALQVDSQHRLWIGYFDRGVDVLPTSGQGAVTHFEDDVLFCVNRIKQDPVSGNILIATANGLAFFDGSGHQRQVLNNKSGLIASHVTDVLFQRTAEGESSTVVATPAGLSFLDGPSISSVYAFQGLVNNHVYTLTETGGTLVAGTLGGVSLLKNGLVQASFTTANSALRQNWITASAALGNDLYLGTYGSGVVQMTERHELQTFREFAGQRVEISPNAMLVTNRAVYAGTAGHGLAVLRPGQQRWQFIEAGLPSRDVTALAADDNFLYIGTDNGLAKISERMLLP